MLPINKCNFQFKMDYQSCLGKSVKVSGPLGYIDLGKSFFEKKVRCIVFSFSDYFAPYE